MHEENKSGDEDNKTLTPPAEPNDEKPLDDEEIDKMLNVDVDPELLEKDIKLTLMEKYKLMTKNEKTVVLEKAIDLYNENYRPIAVNYDGYDPLMDTINGNTDLYKAGKLDQIPYSSILL